MLKALFKVRPHLQFEVEAKEQKDIFEQIAGIQEVFGESNCGMCGKDDLKYTVRTVDDNNFFEIRCNSCGGKLAFSQNKKGGTLYPVRRLKNGIPAKAEDKEGPFDYKTKGWHKYDKNAQAKPADTKKK